MSYSEFEFDLPGALLVRLIQVFDQLTASPLTPENAGQIPEEQGVYQLLHQGEIVYIGKTDAQAGLMERLVRHAYRIQHRLNLSVSDVSFKAVRVFVFTAMDLEAQLIEHYEGHNPNSWNRSGFGSNDPGRNRDMTAAKPQSFDVLYPINLDQLVELDQHGLVTVSEALQALRGALPYTIRWHRTTQLNDIHLPLPETFVTARQVILAVLAVLPSGWQATRLAGRVILYVEHVDNYPGEIIGRSPEHPQQ